MKKEKKAKKQKKKDEDQIPASMMSKINEIIRLRVESELEKERGERKNNNSSEARNSDFAAS